jgi:outer membrane protein assembly factor BamE (lipoprotein component of BamABCDE complex)
MNKIFIIFLFLFISNCKFNKVINHHGVHFLEKKENTLELNITNKNDILRILGPPSTVSSFDNDVWIYIERKNTKSSLIKLGKKKTMVNNVLILEISSNGLLVKKDFLDINDMKKIKFSKKTTEIAYSKNSFVYDFLSSMRQKVNDPLGKRKRKK